MNSAEFYKNHFKMTSHPEGGHFIETYRSVEDCETPNGIRSCSTAIYFLLENGEKSNFHVIASDEMWHHYDGETLEIHEIHPNGDYKLILLGKNLTDGEKLQHLVKAGVIFGSKPKKESSYSFVGCTVSPGFDFQDFKLFTEEELLNSHPKHRNIIHELTPNR